MHTSTPFPAIKPAIGLPPVLLLTRIRPDDQLAELAVSLDKAMGTVKTDIQLLQQTARRLHENHGNGDSDSVAPDIALIARTVNAWDSGASSSN